MDLQLGGKVAIVTGGSAGIGLAIARGLAAEGAHLALCGRDEERLRSAAATLAGVRVLTVAADLVAPGGPERLAEAVTAEFGGADILINNAGTGSEERS